MLKLAIDAALPLITVETDDTVNVGKVLSEIADMPVTEYLINLKPKVDPSFWDVICLLPDRASR